MKRETYDAEIKVRVAGWLKKYLETEASKADLELSDVVRKALKNHVLNKPTVPPGMAVAA